MALKAPSDLDDLQESVRLGCPVLELNGNHTEEPDRHCPTASACICQGIPMSPTAVHRARRIAGAQTYHSLLCIKSTNFESKQAR